MKMTVVGSAAKGKTTLLHNIMNDKSSKIENTATLGVQIKRWTLVVIDMWLINYYYSYQQRPGVQYTVNCWDFAGQEEFYSTHQCFLTPRTIYIVRSSCCVCAYEYCEFSFLSTLIFIHLPTCTTSLPLSLSWHII